jgi:hypothetical protein
VNAKSPILVYIFISPWQLGIKSSQQKQKEKKIIRGGEGEKQQVQ